MILHEPEPAAVQAGRLSLDRRSGAKKKRQSSTQVERWIFIARRVFVFLGAVWPSPGERGEELRTAPQPNQGLENGTPASTSRGHLPM